MSWTAAASVMKSNANGIAGAIADLKAAADGFDSHSPRYE